MPPPVEPPREAITFEHLAEIATGDTARVDLCRGTGVHAGQLLAVKRLHRHIADDPQFAAMFHDEAWMTAALKHRNVVQVAGWGRDAEGMFLAVELVEGVSLARLMKTVFETGEVFSERLVVFIAAEICKGLAAAHDLSSPTGEKLHLVHRDLTPGNVLLSFNGQVKIADFGLAKAKQRYTQTLTGLLKGKPQYMAPEQARGGEIDGRADLFALGVLMFELLSGRRPWSATSELQIMHVTANEPPLDLKELRPKIDKTLVSIVMRCLAKDPAGRFQRAAEIEDLLVEWLTAHGYLEGSDDALGRFVRRNAMRQMRWFERAIAGELSPSATPGRVLPPRVPSYTGATGAPVSLPPAPSPKRARVRSRRTVTESESTSEVTEVEQRAPAFEQGRARGDERAARGPADEWSEELPTLVQRAGSPFSAEIARSLGRKAPPPRPPVIDEDSDGRTTAIKRHPLLRATLNEAAEAARNAPPRISDSDSEDVSTIPLTGVIPASLRRNPPSAPSAQTPSGGVPGHVVPPEPGAPAPPPGPRFNAPPLSALEAGAMRSSSFPSPPTASPPGGVRAVGGPEDLAAEADRMGRDASRLGEEARAAAALASQKSALARLAGDAARYAAEAARLAAANQTAQALGRMETARAIWSAIERGEIDPAAEAALAMPPHSVRPSAPPQAVTQPLVDLNRALPLPPNAGANRPSTAPAAMPSGPQGMPSSMPSNMPSALPSNMPPPRMSVPPPNPFAQTGSGFGAPDSALAPPNFRPEILGLPVGVAALLGLGLALLFIILLWLLLA